MEVVLKELSNLVEEEEKSIKDLEKDKHEEACEYLPVVYDFESAIKSRLWMRDIIVQQSKVEDDSDEEITEEEYRHMLKMHKFEQKIKSKSESDPTTKRFKHYSSDIVTHEKKWLSHYRTFVKPKKKKPKTIPKDTLKTISKTGESIELSELPPTLIIDVKKENNLPVKETEIIIDAQTEKSNKKRKVDVDVLRKRVWRFIARKEIPKAYRQKCQLRATNYLSSRKFCKEMARRARCKALASQKVCKETVSRARRLTREMQLYWKRYEKVEKVHRKKAEKHAQEQRKIDESIREAKRQQRKLNFLISQTELFAHFLGKKLSVSQSAEENYEEKKENILNALTDDFASTTLAIESLGGHGNAALAQAEAESHRQQALRTVEEALQLHKSLQGDFSVPQAAAPNEFKEEDISQPCIFHGKLKSYQLKGMSWLVNLYQQGISGILADEMGLGKTVQTIAFLAHLAETVGIWGPFLVIAPASTLNNWHQEFSRFLPDFKVLPYWGNTGDRKILRKFWSQASTCTDKESAPFHVLVTSYQLIISDVRCFQRVKWQFMVLDEAQALKSSSSMRWKVLLEFRCRNRLLLTGTPIQNTMAELWALLHFIMPSLFDSHAEFDEWFSKDIESHIENKSNIDERQLSRLHLILKPFMLRRIKRDVENELSEKIEVRVHCSMTPRQSRLYKGLQRNLKLEDLLQTDGNQQTVPGNTTLMNLVMQFRKMCNHPDLFERREVVSPLRVSVLTYHLPKLIYNEGIVANINPTRKKILYYDLNVHQPANIFENLCCFENSLFSFLPFVSLSLGEYWKVMQYDLQIMMKTIINENDIKTFLVNDLKFSLCLRKKLSSVKISVSNFFYPVFSGLCFTNINEAVYEIITCRYNTSRLYTTLLIPDVFQDLCSPKIICKPCSVYCNDSNAFKLINDYETGICKTFEMTALFLYGLHNFNTLVNNNQEHLNARLRWQSITSGANKKDYFHTVSRSTGISNISNNWCKVCIPSKEYLVTDSGKLYALDVLLKRLKYDNHRVLIYSQMTKMIDLLEEYMLYRKHTYIRLDGSSRISDRRDMVADFQERDDIFVFLLSTRAGGLGINLTAADTVIFYDSDWNPTVDQQAMDRTHRLGQTKQVTVYRLVCQGTVDERILERAEEKSKIQQMVISGGHFKQDNLKTKEVVSLLLDDEQLLKKWSTKKEELLNKKQQYHGKKRGRKTNAEREELAKKLKKDSGATTIEHSLEPTVSSETPEGSLDGTPASSPSSAANQDIAINEEDSLIVVDDDTDGEFLSPTIKPPIKGRSRSRGRPRIRPLQPENDGTKKSRGRGGGRPRGSTNVSKRGRKPVWGRAAVMAGARAGAVAGSAAAYAAYGYEYKEKISSSVDSPGPSKDSLKET